MQTMKNLTTGQKGRIVRIHGEGAARRRIMDMGVTRGTEFLVRKVAPLGDPIEISIRGYELTFRRREGEMIEVKIVS